MTNEPFVAQVHQRIDKAAERIYIQVMTFDGDSAGIGVAERLIAAAARGVDVRITVDLFAFRYVSDTKMTNPMIAEEVRETHAMFDRMAAAGIDIVYVGPWGPMLAFSPIRHHKKIFVFDDTAYLGGINISDHNFAWFDVAVAIHEPTTVEEIVDDFHQTRLGKRVARRGAIITNEGIEDLFGELIDSAESSILLASPYALDRDLDHRLAAAGAPKKMVITPRTLNSRLLEWAAQYRRVRVRRNDVELFTFDEFFHAKFLLVDESTLLVGSSNFGRHSFRCNQEICVVIEDASLIATLLEMLPDKRELEHTSSLGQMLRGFVVESIINLGVSALGKVAVQRVPIVTSREPWPNRRRW